MKKTAIIIFMMVLLIGFAGTAGATLFTSSGATADFTINGSGQLVVTLTNTSSADVLDPSQVLTAVFFNLSDNLNPVSATVTSGSIVYDPAHATTTNVGGEWAYSTGLSGAPLGDNSGISSTGLGLFSFSNFNGPELAGPTNGALDGLQYGITSAGDNLATGNTAILDSGGLIKNQVVFTLSGLPIGFDTNSISNVFFQYGTSLNESQVPEPSSLLLLGSGSLGLGLFGRKRFRK